MPNMLMTEFTVLAAEGNILYNILDLFQTALMMLGGFGVVWGGIQIGLALWGGAGSGGGGGAQISTAIAAMIGGAIIIAAAVYLGTLDTGWLNTSF